jgi:hypothetical protein
MVQPSPARGAGEAQQGFVYRSPAQLNPSPEVVPAFFMTPDQSDPLPDSGQRAQFATGAVRDLSLGKGHFHSIPPIALRKLAKRFEDGARKYAKNNFAKGIPLSHFQDSLTRHILAWAEGDETEDHAGAILWNAAVMIWTDEEIKAGRLPKELDDLLYRNRCTTTSASTPADASTSSSPR